MKHSVAWALSLSLVSAGTLLGACSKPSDVPALREADETLVARTGPRVAAVKFRLGAVGMFTGADRRFSNAPDFHEAQRIQHEGMAEVNALELELLRAPKEIDEAAKDETGAKLSQFFDEKHEEYDEKITRAIADAEIGETWVARQQAAAAALVAQAQQAPAKPADPAAAASDQPTAPSTAPNPNQEASTPPTAPVETGRPVNH